MPLPDLTNQYIQDTYQRVLQVADDGTIRNGTGSLFLGTYSGSFSGSFVGDGSGLTGITADVNTGSFATTGSNTFIGNQIITGSVDVNSGNVNIGSNSYFFQGTSTGGTNISLIGVNSQDEIYIGNQGYTNIIADNTNIEGNTQITGSLIVSGSGTITGSLNVTGSVNFKGGPVTISGSSPGGPPSVLRLWGDMRTKGYHRFQPVETNIDFSESGSYIYVSGSTEDLYFTQNGKGYNNTTRLRWLEGNLYTGILWGGIVSGSAGGTTFSVTEGAGIIVNMNTFTGSEGPNPTINHVTWDTFSNVTPTYLNSNDTTWLLINSDGQLEQQTTGFLNGDYDYKLPIGQLIHPNLSTISLFKTNPIPSYAIGQQSYEFIRAFGALKMQGHTVAASGSSLYVNRSSGISYALGRNYVNDPNKPSYITDDGKEKPNLFKYYKSGSIFVTSTGVDTIDPNVYNTPSTATGLSAVPGGQFTIKRFFYFPNEPDFLGVYYGRTLYNSLSTALANLPYETFEENDNTANQAIFCGYLIVKGGTTNLSNTSNAKFVEAGLFRTTTAGGAAATTTKFTDLSDVTITSPSNNQIVSYESSTSQWKNKSTISLTSITASGDISASGDITSNTGSFNRIYIPQSGLTEAIIDFNGGSKIGGNAQGGTDLLLSANDDMVFGAGDDVTFYSASIPDNNIPSADSKWLEFNKGARTLTFGPAANKFTFNGAITASGDISSSGEITTNGFTNVGSTSLTLSSSFTTTLNFSTNRIMSVTTGSALTMSIDADNSILGNVIMTDISSSVGLNLPSSEFKVLNGTFDTTKRNYVYYHYIGNDTALVTINQEQ